MDSVMCVCVCAYINTYICNNHNQRKRLSIWEGREDIGGVEGGWLEEGGKRGGESDLIPFQYETYEK